MIAMVSTERKHWVDVAKGILIFLVVWGHLDWIAETFAGTNAFAYKAETNFAFLPYYMPAFFILTGMCSNFYVPWKSFVIKNFKSLMIPSILLGVLVAKWLRQFFEDGMRWDNFIQSGDLNSIFIGGGAWFLSALFISKCVFYVLLHLNIRQYQVFFLSVIMMIVGIVMYNRQYLNIWHYQHALIALPFLVSGHWLRKRHEMINKPIVMVFGILSLLYTYMYSYPFFNAGPSITWQTSILFIFLSISGSLLLFYISRVISISSYIECVGRHTLTIYLLHCSVMIPLVKLSLISGVLGGGTLSVRVLVGLLVVLVSMGICLVMDIFIDRHLAFMKGKF